MLKIHLIEQNISGYVRTTCKCRVSEMAALTTALSRGTDKCWLTWTHIPSSGQIALAMAERFQTQLHLDSRWLDGSPIPALNSIGLPSRDWNRKIFRSCHCCSREWVFCVVMFANPISISPKPNPWCCRLFPEVFPVLRVSIPLLLFDSQSNIRNNIALGIRYLFFRAPMNVLPPFFDPLFYYEVDTMQAGSSGNPSKDFPPC